MVEASSTMGWAVISGASTSWYSAHRLRASADGEGGFQTAHRTVTREHVDLTRLHDEAATVVEEAEVLRAKAEGHRCRRARFQRHPLEATQPAYRLGDARHRVLDVE